MLNLVSMFILGAVFGISVVMIIVIKIFGDDYKIPTDEEMCDMCEWYEAEYGKENNND